MKWVYTRIKFVGKGFKFFSKIPYFCTKQFLLKTKVFLITPPFTQLNTPYPATAYIKGFLNTKNISATQADLGIEVILELFSKKGLEDLFKSNTQHLTPNTQRILALQDLKDKIFDENVLLTQKLFSIFHPYIKKFIYIGTAFSSGVRKGLIANDFHNLDFKPEHRNAYEYAKFHSENFIAKECKAIRPSVIGGKMLGTENNYFIPKYMVFYLLAKFFYFTSKRKGKQETVRFIINTDTGLNIIPVDYVAKVIVTTFERDDIEQLNIVNYNSFLMFRNDLDGIDLRTSRNLPFGIISYPSALFRSFHHV